MLAFAATTTTEDKRHATSSGDPVKVFPRLLGGGRKSLGKLGKLLPPGKRALFLAKPINHQIRNEAPQGLYIPSQYDYLSYQAAAR